MWPALHTEAGLDAARELMRVAVREGEDARDAAACQWFVTELGHTQRQFGDLIAHSADDVEDEVFKAAFEEAVSRTEQAVAVLALHERAPAEPAAEWPAADLERPAEAAARTRGDLAAYEDADAEEGLVRVRRTKAERLLRVLGEPSED
ncbi:hypothetical protein [Streptomyces sp. JNUCC 63]